MWAREVACKNLPLGCVGERGLEPPRVSPRGPNHGETYKVLGTGLEPAHLAVRGPKPRASTNSATPAL